MAISPKEHALKLIKEFKARGPQGSDVKGNIWLHLFRDRVADGLENRIYFPHNLNQLNTNICGVAAFVRQWIQDDPVGYAWLGISLFENGCGYVGRGKYHGRDIRPSKELRNSQVPSRKDKKSGAVTVMNHADWIVMASIREAFNDVYDYSANEGPFAIRAWNFPSEVVDTFKAAGYSNVVDDTDWGNTQSIISLMEASRKFQDKWRVVLLINMRMLDDSKLDTQAAFPTSDHWVGLQSAIPVTMVGSEYRVSKFKVFTWGKERTVPESDKVSSVSLEALLKNYYGYIAAKY